MTDTIRNLFGSKRPRRMAREPQADAEVTSMMEAAAPGPKPKSKAGLVLDLLARPDGATLGQLVEITGWLPHTARAALTGIKKKGHALTSEKVEGGLRIYRVIIPAELAV